MYLPDYLSIDAPVEAPSGDLGAFCVTFDAKWIPYLLALIRPLTLPQVWTSDRETASGEASILLSIFMGAGLCDTESHGGLEVEDDMCGCLRWSATGKLQAFSCGVWTDIPGPGPGPAVVTDQPSTGVPQLGAGDCASFLGKVLWGGRWLYPNPVSTGDEVHVTNCEGITTDYALTELLWRCGSGKIFFAGDCVSGTEILDSLAPMPSAPQQALIAFDGVNYYDCSDAANGNSVDFTIGSGVSGGNLVFLINDEVTFGAGDLSFYAQVCKAPDAGEFEHVFDFEHDTDGGWFAVDPGSTGVLAVYTAGQGWQNQPFSGNLTGVIDRTMASTYLSSARVVGYEPVPNTAYGHYFARVGSSPDFDLPNVANVFDTGFKPIGATSDHIRIDFSNDGGTPVGAIKKVIVRGVGADPF